MRELPPRAMLHHTSHCLIISKLSAWRWLPFLHQKPMPHPYCWSRNLTRSGERSAFGLLAVSFLACFSIAVQTLFTPRLPRLLRIAAMASVLIWMLSSFCHDDWTDSTLEFHVWKTARIPVRVLFGRDRRSPSHLSRVSRSL